jgi:hypothetical protein
MNQTDIRSITSDTENKRPVCKYFLYKLNRFKKIKRFHTYYTPLDPKEQLKIQPYIIKYNLDLVDSMLDTYFFISATGDKYIYSNRNLSTGKTTWGYMLFGKFYFTKYEDYDDCC